MAQQSKAKPSLNWDWRQAAELTGTDTIRERKSLTVAQRTSFTRLILQSYGKSDRGDPEQLAKDRAAAEETRIKFVDLNHDGIPELMTQATGAEFCGATGNCTFLIFAQRNGKYVKILDSIAQTYTIQTTVSNGFEDLVLGMHSSSTEQELKFYKYDGHRYLRTACYDSNWSVLGKDGEFHDLKTPRITAMQC
jgi:hypothetical protein